jgi:hypothetical protein
MNSNLVARAVLDRSERRPGRRALFKYASPETTLAILQNRSFRYSSPLTFNDPFDVQTELQVGFDTSLLVERLTERMEYLARNKAVRVRTDTPWGQVIEVARKKYAAHGFPREKWRQTLENTLPLLVDAIHLARSRYRDAWREMLPTLRVFCVSEEPSNLLMWSHYGKDHTGAVFELWSLPDEDNPLSVASPVDYAAAPPPFFTLDDWIDDLTGVRDLDHTELFQVYARTKSEHWAYEKEWRVWWPSKDAGHHTYLPIRKSEFVSLTLGCRAEKDFEDAVRGLLKDGFPDAKLFRARKTVDRFGLEVEPV